MSEVKASALCTISSIKLQHLLQTIHKFARVEIPSFFNVAKPVQKCHQLCNMAIPFVLKEKARNREAFEIFTRDYEAPFQAEQCVLPIHVSVLPKCLFKHFPWRHSTCKQKEFSRNTRVLKTSEMCDQVYNPVIRRFCLIFYLNDPTRVEVKRCYELYEDANPLSSSFYPSSDTDFDKMKVWWVLSPVAGEDFLPVQIIDVAEDKDFDLPREKYFAQLRFESTH